MEEVYLSLVKESALKLSDVYLPKKRACIVYLFKRGKCRYTAASSNDNV